MLICHYDGCRIGFHHFMDKCVLVTFIDETILGRQIVFQHVQDDEGHFVGGHIIFKSHIYIVLRITRSRGHYKDSGVGIIAKYGHIVTLL